MEAGFEEVDRVNLRDLRRQEAGDMTVMHKDYVIEAKSFYADPKSSLDRYRENFMLGANHFIKVPKPSLSDIEQADRIPEVFEHLLDINFCNRMAAEQKSIAAKMQTSPSADEFGVAYSGFLAYRSAKRGAEIMEAVCASIANVVRASNNLGDALNTQMANRSAKLTPLVEMTDVGDAMPPGGNFFEDMGGDQNLAFELLDDEYPAPEEEAVSFSEEAPSTPVRKANVLPVPHGVRIGGAPMNDVSTDVVQNDAVLRMYADLDFEESRTTTEEIDHRIQEDIGSLAEIDFDDLSTAETIDRAAAESEKIREKPAENSEEALISGFLQSLLDTPDEQEGSN